MFVDLAAWLGVCTISGNTYFSVIWKDYFKRNVLKLILQHLKKYCSLSKEEIIVKKKISRRCSKCHYGVIYVRSLSVYGLKWGIPWYFYHHMRS